MARVSVDDLLLAAEWCESYEAAPEDEANKEALLRVARWLEAEAAKRQEDAVVHAAAQRYGVTPAKARAALRRSRGQ